MVFIFVKGHKTSQLSIEIDNNTWMLPTERWENNHLLSIDYRLKPDSMKLIDKINKNTNPISSFGKVVQGLTAYDKYQGQDPKIIKERGYHHSYKKDDTCGKWLSGKDINRYCQTWSEEWLSYGPWLAAPREKYFFEEERILFREVPGKNKRIQATIVEGTFYYGHSITPFKKNFDEKISLKYLLGIINSKLVSYYAQLLLPNFGKNIFPKLNPNDIKLLPIYSVDLTDQNEKACYDQIISLVEKMLDMNQQFIKLNTPIEKNIFKRQIETTDNQIDQLVYQLYALTDEEIQIIESEV